MRQYGLGITFYRADGSPGMVVKRIKEGSGADLLKGEIGPGDRLLEIDNVIITGLSTSALAKLVLGKENTKARVKVGLALNPKP